MWIGNTDHRKFLFRDKMLIEKTLVIFQFELQAGELCKRNNFKDQSSKSYLELVWWGNCGRTVHQICYAGSIVTTPTFTTNTAFLSYLFPPTPTLHPQMGLQIVWGRGRYAALTGKAEGFLYLPEYTDVWAWTFSCSQRDTCCLFPKLVTFVLTTPLHKVKGQRPEWKHRWQIAITPYMLYSSLCT